MARQETPAMFVYVGTYTATPPHARGRAEGIYVYRLDPASGALTRAGTIPGVVNPSFLAPDPRRRYLYAANEASEIDGQAGPPPLVSAGGAEGGAGGAAARCSWCSCPQRASGAGRGRLAILSTMKKKSRPNQNSPGPNRKNPG